MRPEGIWVAVIAFQNGYAALFKVTAQTGQLVILLLIVPVADGIAQAILNVEPETPV